MAEIKGVQDYHRALIEIEALWDFSRESGEREWLLKLIDAVEAFETSGLARPERIAAAPPSNVVVIPLNADAVAKMGEQLVLSGFVGWRSAVAAIRACNVLMEGDVVAAINWMNRRLFGIGLSPLELAEQDDSGLQFVLDEIVRIDAGVFH